MSGVPATGVAAEERWLVDAVQQATADALRADGGDAGALLDAGCRLLWLGFWPFAEDAASQVLALASDDAEATALLAGVRQEQGRLHEADTLAAEALQHDGNAPLARVIQARLWAARGQRDAAIEALQEIAARETAPAAAAAFLLGSLLTDAGQFAAATPWLDRASTWLPGNGGGKAAYIATIAAFAELLAGREPYRTDGGTNNVPMRLLPLPAVHGTLSGRGITMNGWFVLDCGASLTVLGPAAAALARESTAQASMMTVAGQTRNVAALLDRVSIGDLVIDDVPVLVNHDEKAPHAEGVVATLGVGLLRRFRVTLDLPGLRCRLDPPHSAADPDPAAEVPFELVHNVIVVRGRFRGGEVRPFVFDSGANNLFVSPRVLAQEFGAMPGRLRKQVAFGGTETTTIEVPLPRPFVFGGRELTLRFAIGDPSIDMRNAHMRLECAGTVGLVIRARYVLDFDRQRLLLYER